MLCVRAEMLAKAVQGSRWNRYCTPTYGPNAPVPTWACWSILTPLSVSSSGPVGKDVPPVSPMLWRLRLVMLVVWKTNTRAPSSTSPSPAAFVLWASPPPVAFHSLYAIGTWRMTFTHLDGA